MQKLVLPFLFPSKALDPERCSALLSQGVRTPTDPQGASRRPLLLSRARYRQRVFSLAAVPRADRRAAVRNLLLSWGPFDDAEYRVALSADSALAFAWDRQAAAADLEAAGIAPDRPLMPEGLYRPVPTAPGLRLQASLEGYEVQVWKDGLPVESHWWPRRPTEQDWQVLLRSRHAHDAAQSAVIDAGTPWQAKPWVGSMPLEELDRGAVEFERLLFIGIACGLVGLAAMQAKDLYSAHGALQHAKQDYAELTQKATPIAVARAEALQLSQQVKLLSDAMTAPQAIEVMQHLAEQLPKSGVTLREFDLRGATLRVSLALAPNVQRSEILKGLQGGGWFVDVSELRDGTTTAEVANFEMRLRATRPGPIAAVPEPSASSPPAALTPAGAGVPLPAGAGVPFVGGRP